ncbi:DUF3800 domain-containing protein [Microbacterium xylanilyticum]
MYLLFVDESGTHPGPHPFVLGAMAIHEDDAAQLQRQLDQIVIEHLGRVPPNLDEYEVHASEMRNAKKPKDGSSPQNQSIWANVDRAVRLAILDAVYEKLTTFIPSNAKLPAVLFGVAVERDFHSDWSQIERDAVHARDHRIRRIGGDVGDWLHGAAPVEHDADLKHHGDHRLSNPGISNSTAGPPTLPRRSQ